MDNKSNVNKVAIKHDWYQTESHVIIVILVKNIKNENIIINYSKFSLKVNIEVTPECNYNLFLNLSNSIVPNQCSFKVFPLKVEVKLRKSISSMWSTLETIQLKSSGPSNVKVKPSVDWDHFVQEEVEGNKEYNEDSANNFLQKIYGEGNDEIKKAMIKSFTESNGTVLSTNWKEVSKDKVNINPPDGMEWKKWQD